MVFKKKKKRARFGEGREGKTVVVRGGAGWSVAGNVMVAFPRDTRGHLEARYKSSVNGPGRTDEDAPPPVVYVLLYTARRLN